jgi:GNAT superfamily N-acetyltransferase
MRSSEPLSVRAAKRADLPRIRDLLSALAGTPLTSKEAANRFRLVTANPEEELVIACAGAEAIGLLAFRIRHNVESVSHYGEVSAIVVDDAWRNKGVGRLLIDRAEAIARRRKCIGLWLVSGFGREEEAHEFYRRMGFASTGMRFVKRFEA